MYVKLIDSSGATHYIECTAAVWLGEDRHMAEGYDGPEGITHYGFRNEPDFRLLFIAITPRHGRRFIACDHWLGAWLMSDTGKTVDTLLSQPYPASLLPRQWREDDGD